MFGRHFLHAALCVTLLTITVLMTQAKAQSTTRSFYDNRGSFAGSSVTRGNSTSFSDGQGRSPEARSDTVTPRRSTTRVAITPDHPSTHRRRGNQHCPRLLLRRHVALGY
jgi:hypothetical protein